MEATKGNSELILELDAKVLKLRIEIDRLNLIIELREREIRMMQEFNEKLLEI